MTTGSVAPGSGRPRWRDERVRLVVGGLLLVALTALLYRPTLSSGFIWDDDDNVTANLALRTAHGLVRIWTEPGATQQYYPATHTSFWVERRLWGDRPAGYHADNLLLHALGSVLLWRLLRGLEIPGAWLGAALFALHPMQVEPSPGSRSARTSSRE